MKWFMVPLAIGAVALVLPACEDDDDDDPGMEEKGGGDSDKKSSKGGDPDANAACSMSFTLQEGDYLEVDIECENEADEQFVWIDRNGNGTKDEGEAFKGFGPWTALEELPTGQAITIYGRVTTFATRTYKLSAVDVSGNKELKELALIDAHLPSLDLSKNEKLEFLKLENSPEMQSLDLSKNVALKRLLLSFMDMASLSLGQNAKLEHVEATNVGNVTSLDFSACSKLKFVRWGRYDNCKNKLASIDVSGCPELESLTIASNSLQSLDVSNNHKLLLLSCLGDVNVSTIVGEPTVVYGKLQALDVSNCPDLSGLDFTGNKVMNLDVSKNPKLYTLDVSYNPLTEIKVTPEQKAKYDAGQLDWDIKDEDGADRGLVF
ncbi:MAG: hypothetical protein CSA97_04165 [Bacteroidetes bacterium]|nr:MAG: hypothetical protein CSA97_04165 [Bacteroidota bacterium]